MRNWLIKLLGGYTKDEFDQMKDRMLGYASALYGIKNIKYKYPKGHKKAGKFCKLEDYLYSHGVRRVTYSPEKNCTITYGGKID